MPSFVYHDKRGFFTERLKNSHFYAILIKEKEINKEPSENNDNEDEKQNQSLQVKLNPIYKRYSIRINIQLKNI